MEKIYGFKENGSKVETITRKEFIDSAPTIFMSDSYGVGYSAPSWVTGWPEYTRQALGLSEDVYYNISESGAGFLKAGDNGNTFLTLLQNNLNNITNKENIKRLVLCAGGNDARYYVDNNIETTTPMDEAISTFVTFVQNEFPNIEIMFGMITNFACWRNENERDFLARQKLPIILSAYKNSIKYNVQYLSGVETIMKNYSYFSSDKVHPDQNGYIELGRKIAQAIKTGYIECKDIYAEDEVTLYDIFDTNNGNFAYGSNTTLSGNNVTWGLRTIQLIFSTPQTYGTESPYHKTITIGTINPKYYRTNYDNLARIVTSGWYSQSDGQVFSGIFIIYISEQGEIKINTPVLMPGETQYHTPTNVVELHLQSGHTEINTLYC